MKSFTRIKIIKGKEYLYEITPYYDPRTKRIRHRSRYLGKNKEGKPVRVREHIPRYALSYGELIPFLGIIEELGIRDILSDYLSLEDVERVIGIVLNRVTQPVSLMHIESWYKGTYLYSAESPSMSSQAISRVLERIGCSALPHRFMERFIKRLKTIKTMVYDITSLSSYSKGIDILEYGYGDGLAQINLSLVVDRDMGVAVTYEIYPGSIVDVSTLKGTIERLKGYGVEECLMVLDRGFFSRGNIEGLMEAGVSFIMAGSMSSKEIRKAMNLIKGGLSDPNQMKIYNGKPLFVSGVKVRIGSKDVSGYCYYMPSKAKEEEEGFYRRLYDIKEAIERLSWKEAKWRTEEIAGSYRQYLSISIRDKAVVVKIRKNAVSQRVNRMGRFILLYNGQIDWLECLSLYRGKDIVEKGFEILKNDLQAYTPHVRKEETLRGLLFICFIGLILKMRLNKKMKESGLMERHSMEGLLLELSKLKIIELTDGRRIKTEITKKQKEILSSLNLCA